MPVCKIDENPLKEIVARQSDDDYSCSESKPCSNGACCSKKTGYCNYGPEACGPDIGNNPSPNEVCWSNCDATAECGKFALPKGKECPLNVCCSEFGFCGMTEDFCDKGESDDEGCQSNCDQPGSGSSGGDVQSTVIGYYEAWAHDRSCQSMDFEDIPVGALTHLYFSFAYVTPGDFRIAPMDDLPESLFSDLTAVKKKNPALKAVVALGGWTFNDPGTATQPVFSNICSSSENRAAFITNLLSFMREYAFDGVDFDWEYPGAPDRGGHPDDGKNFVLLLKELQDAISDQPLDYVVSFTAPTSYWYLRWFDLSAVEHVDHINVMSYDLHGVWDSNNPIGNNVLAHTNLTEIDLALDLFWRNDVPPEKIILGVGFYGRSFQLSDASCFRPGCKFKGGASPGSCTKNSGTLSYREITSIIDQHDLKPYHDEDAAVKYITWDNDQWVSYDDGDTFKQKVEFGNKLGLGGLLIWSIDQDTDDLKALSALLAPKELNTFKKSADNAAFWQDVSSADCYVTDCGGSCKAGFISITDQPCGGAKPIIRTAKDDPSKLCCPLTAAPDPDKCTWRGSAPSCNGHCHDNEVLVQMNRWGSGAYCEDGNKAYCCETADHSNGCYWTGAGGQCKKGDELFTFAGTFLETIVDVLEIFPPTLIGVALEEALSGVDMELERRYCCPPEEAKLWKNCAWHGKPGSCFDNHCDVGHQVQLTSSDYGLGESCFPRSERTRVYCCDAADGSSPFLPVPLEDLFPHPPTGDDVDVDTDLRIDNTWGTGDAETGNDEPNESTFGFVVLASPEELQVTLDKRDGSDWEVFNCNDAVSEEEQTIQVYCGKEDTTNCDKIHLGHGVPGTILEMPSGCGPSRYAVAKDLTPSDTQHFPHHLEKRTYAHRPTIYDLTFDFEWRRVPRDLGDTQMRLDYSNEVGYWDSIVDKAASKKKKKRSLHEIGGNHKRWLEDEWRDDHHFGALDKEELHKRWFGEDVVAWLKGFFNPEIKQEYTHDLATTFTAKLIEEDWDCNIGGADVEAHLLVQALLDVNVHTSFGLTIIATLGSPGNPIDLSSSYLYFKNQGEVSAIFTLDALGKVKFDKQLELLNLQNFPGATFGIPKLVTVGPNFRLLGSVDAELTLSGHLESRARIAAWDVQQTYPAPNSEWMPKDLSDVSVDGTGDFKGLSEPTFDYSVTTTGSLSAHLKPTFEFGINFDDIWSIPSARVQLVADGSVKLHAKATTDTDQCPFTYGLDVGARLYAHVDAPSFGTGWEIPDFDIYPLNTKSPISGGSCPKSEKRSLLLGDVEQYEESEYNSTRPAALSSRDIYYMEDVVSSVHDVGHHLSKRAGTYGPPIHLPRTGCLFCPKPSDDNPTDCSTVTGWEESQLTASTNNQLSLTKRDFIDVELDDSLHSFEKRADKNQAMCKGNALMRIVSPDFQTSGAIVGTQPNIASYGYTNPTVCNDFGFQRLAQTPDLTNAANRFATEHILEFQLIQIFIDEYAAHRGSSFPNPTGGNGQVDLCKYMEPYWYSLPSASRITINGETATPMQFIASAFPGSFQGTARHLNEFVLLDSGVNTAKEGMWGRGAINSDSTMQHYEQSLPDKEVRNLKDVLSAYKYHMIPQVSQILTDQRNRVGNLFAQVEQTMTGLSYSTGGRKPVTVAPYQPIGLQQAWLAWSSGRLDAARARAETYMDQYLQNLQNGYATPSLRDAAQRAANAGDNGPQTLIGKIDALSNAIANRPAWNAPF